MTHWAARGKPVRHQGRFETCTHDDCRGDSRQVPRAGTTCGIVVASGRRSLATGLPGTWTCGLRVGHAGGHRRRSR